MEAPSVLSSPDTRNDRSAGAGCGFRRLLPHANTQVDGPQHFAVTTQDEALGGGEGGGHLLGNTAVRNACIRALGYDLISIRAEGVDFWDRGSMQMQMQVLGSRIRELEEGSGGSGGGRKGGRK